MAARAFGDDHRRHEHAKSPTRAGVRASGRRADLSHRSRTAGQPCRRSSFAQILGGSPSGAQRRLVPAGCGRVARDRRAAAWACIGIGVASRRRALLRGRSSPNRNSARRWSRVRALRANVSGGPIESHASHSPCVRGLVARDPRPAVPKCGVTCGGRPVRVNETRRIRFRRWLPSRRLARRSRSLVLGGMWLRWRTGARAQELDGFLARGADLMDSDELSLRVGQLGSARSRAYTAMGVRLGPDRCSYP